MKKLFLQIGFRGRLALYGTTLFLVGMSAATLGPTLPSLAINTNTTLGTISLLFVLRSFARLMGVTSAGFLYDRLSGHLIFVGGLISVALAMFQTGNAQTFLILGMTFLLLGFAEGVLDTGGTTLVVWSKKGKLGATLPILYFMYGAGSFVAPLVIAQIISFGWEPTFAYWILPLLVIVPIPLLLILPSPEKQHGNKQKSDDSSNEQPYILLMTLLCLIALYVGIEASFSGWIFSYGTISGIATEVEAAYLTSTYWAMLSLGRLLMIPIAERVQPHRILLVAIIIVILCAIAISLSTTALLLGLSTAVFGLFMSPIFPTIMTIAAENLNMSAKVTSWFFMSTGIAAMILPWVMGQFIEEVGISAVTLGTLGLVIVMGILYIPLRYRLVRLSPLD